MATVKYTYNFSGNLNLEISHNKVSGAVILSIVNSINQNVITTFTAEQLEKLKLIYDDFTKLRETNDLDSVTVS